MGIGELFSIFSNSIIETINSASQASKWPTSILLGDVGLSGESKPYSICCMLTLTRFLLCLPSTAEYDLWRGSSRILYDFMTGFLLQSTESILMMEHRERFDKLKFLFLFIGGDTGDRVPSEVPSTLLFSLLSDLVVLSDWTLSTDVRRDLGVYMAKAEDGAASGEGDVSGSLESSLGLWTGDDCAAAACWAAPKSSSICCSAEAKGSYLAMSL